MTKTTKHHKLVRDKIPQLIKDRGARCETEILPDYKRQAFLFFKLHEEVDEFMKSPSKEEYGDVMEVLKAIKIHMGWEDEELEKAQTDKYNERGGFEKFILLRHVEED
jgi:predicted house-cleaning noncanonical NTP pyrophosphatase (MazG superfamily)